MKCNKHNCYINNDVSFYTNILVLHCFTYIDINILYSSIILYLFHIYKFILEKLTLQIYNTFYIYKYI